MGKSQSKLTAPRLEELQRETHFSAKELQQWYKVFMKDCQGGSLSVDDFLKIYQDFFPGGDPSAYAAQIFGAFDQNQDGLISFEEYISALSVTSRGDMNDKLEWAFRVYDINRDGKISFDEMLTTVKAIFQMVGEMINLPEDENTPEKRAEKIFKLANKDENGYLDKNEFKEICAKDEAIVAALEVYQGAI